MWDQEDPGSLYPQPPVIIEKVAGYHFLFVPPLLPILTAYDREAVFPHTDDAQTEEALI